jgi:hypothetical protein
MAEMVVPLHTYGMSSPGERSSCREEGLQIVQTAYAYASAASDDLLNVIRVFDGRCQVLSPTLGDDHIIFDPAQQRSIRTRRTH